MTQYIIIGMLVFSIVTGIGGIYVGVQYQKGRELAAVEKRLKEDRNKIAKLEKEKLESERKLRDQIKKVRNIKGECLDHPYNDNVLDGLWRR